MSLSRSGEQARPANVLLCRVWLFDACRSECSHEIAQRWDDAELRACKGRKEIKELLLHRHAAWKQYNGWS